MSPERREDSSIARFLDAARAWTAAMRASLQTRDLAAVSSLVSDYESLEKRARILAAALRGAGRIPESERASYLAALRELSRAAHVAAALSESEVLYLRWGQTVARPAREYTSSGAAASERQASASWEA